MTIRFNLLILLVILLIVSLPFVTLSVGQFFGSWISPYYIFAISLFFYCLYRDKNSIEKLFKFKSSGSLLLFLLLIFVSIVISCAKGILDLKVQLKYIIFFLIYLSIALSLFLGIKNKHIFKLSLKAMARTSCFVFIFGIYQYISLTVMTLPYSNVFYNNGQGLGFKMGHTAPYLFIDRAWSTFPEPWVLSSYILVILPIFIAIYFSKNKSSFLSNNLLIATIVLGLINFILSRSSGSLFALCVGSVITLSLTAQFKNILSFVIKNIKKLGLLLVMFSILFVYVALPLSERITSALNLIIKHDITLDLSYATRLIGQITALNVFKENPTMGIGFGNFSNQYVNYLDNMILTKEINQYISRGERLNPYGNFTRVLSEMGIIGFISFCLILIFLARDCLYISKNGNEVYANIGRAYLFSLCVINAHGLIDTTFLVPQWWLLCGLIMATKKLTILEIQEKNAQRLLEVNNEK